MYARITCRAWAIVALGGSVMGSTITPFSLRFTFSTSRACRSTGKIFMDDSNPAFLRQRDRQRCFGNGIHRRGNEGNIQFNVPREPRMGIRIGRNKFTASGNQQHIIKRDRIVNNLGVIHVQIIDTGRSDVKLRHIHTPAAARLAGL